MDTPYNSTAALLRCDNISRNTFKNPVQAPKKIFNVLMDTIYDEKLTISLVRHDELPQRVKETMAEFYNMHNSEQAGILLERPNKDQATRSITRVILGNGGSRNLGRTYDRFEYLFQDADPTRNESSRIEIQCSACNTRDELI